MQTVWAELETEFRNKSAEIEAEAQALRSNGQAERARSCLTRFMNKNLAKVLAALHALQTELEDNG